MSSHDNFGFVVSLTDRVTKIKPPADESLTVFESNRYGSFCIGQIGNVYDGTNIPYCQ